MTRPTEVPVYFPASNETLFGIYTVPSRGTAQIGVVILEGGGHTNTSFQRNAVATRMADRLARSGFPVLRFDYHGLADSTGRVQRFLLDKPFVDDLQAALAWLADRGITRFVLVGTCFGSRTALAMARDLEGLVGLALIAMPVADQSTRAAHDLGAGEFLRRALRISTFLALMDRSRRHTYRLLARAKLMALARRFRARPATTQGAGSWVSEAVVEQLRGLLDRRLPMLFIYGTEDGYYRHFREVTDGPLAGLDNRTYPQVEIEEFEGEVHGYPTLAAQDHVIDGITAWLERVRSGTTTGTSSGEPLLGRTAAL